MKLAILSCSPKAYSTRRLREAARQRGHQVRVLNTLKFAIDVEEGAPDLYYKQRHLSHYDAVLPRIGASITYYGTAVVRQFQEMDTFCANTAHGISNSRDKLRALQILSRHHIGIPRTTFVRDKKDVLPAIERVGGAPVIIKLIEGTQGIGVLLAESVKAAESIIELLQSQKQNVLIQKFVAESKGKDVRAIVVGDRVVAAMRRVAQGGEFRSNVHRGGRTEAVELSAAYERTAIRAAQVLGLNVAGVDMLEGAEGPEIMEVNSSPGLEGIEGATGKDVAGEMVRFVEERLRVSEFHPDAWAPLVVRDPAQTRAGLLAIAGDKYTYKELDDFTDLMKRTFQTVKQVSKVDRSGVLDEQVTLSFSQERIASYGVPMGRLQEVLRARTPR